MQKAIIFLIFTLSFGFISAQEEYESEEFKHFRVAFGIGQGYISQADSKNSKFLIIPTIGLDLQYWFNQKWGIALKSDLEITNYLVEKEHETGDQIERENPFIITLPVLFSPWENGWSFLVGPGIESEKKENFSILRLGVGHEFEIANEWDFAPEFFYDLKDGSISAFTVAIGVGKRF
jgi:outer membrane protein with beta-barrel domain